MGVLNVDDLKAGMVLDQPVANKHGTLLLDKGMVLTEKHITIFKTWGITEADIQGVDREQLEAQEMDALPENVLDSIENDLAADFTDFGQNEVMKEIYRIAKKFRINDAMKQGEQGSNGSKPDAIDNR
jgi:hypothetical protein